MEDQQNHTMDQFCGSTFWDSAVTWDTEDPDLTDCFQNTVLIWAPCIFLWVFLPLEAYYLLHSKRRNVPYTWKFYSKAVLTAALIILSIVDIGKAIHDTKDRTVYGVDYYTPVIKILTFTLAGALLHYNRKYGMRASGLLFLFWFLLAVCGISRYRSLLRASGDQLGMAYASGSYMVYYPIVLIIFVLNFFSDPEPKFSEYPPVERPCPEQAATFPSKLLFAWFDSLAWRGFKKPLEASDLWSMNPEDMAKEIVPQFDKYWDQSLRKSDNIQTTKASFRKVSGQVDFNSGRKKKVASVLTPLCKAFGPTFIFGALLKLSIDIMTFISPQLLKLLIAFIEGPEEMWKGYFYALMLLLTAMVQTLILSQYFHRMFLVGLRIRTALIAAIYRKALRMSNAARKESTVGEIVNLMSVDAQRFMDLTAYINLLWSAPLQIALALYFLWEILGPSVLAGLAVMIILIPVNGMIANKVKTLQIRQMKSKDERVKLMNEVLNGIKVLKLYAWEPSFEQQILAIRNKEIQVLKEAAYLNAGTSFIWSCAPFLVSLVSFATFVLIDEKNVLDSTTAFVSLSLFNILRFPLSMLPMMISSMVQASVSVKRINVFMNTEELDPNNVQHDKSEVHPLIIENGNFLWDAETGEKSTLRNINLQVEHGQLVAVVGTVGSGKSSLISAFLGEMDRTSGRVNTKGTIAYVSQQAWIQNATLQNNILFGKPMDKALYNRVVEACALGMDLKMLPAGDQTEIGEKGINLSGGQKQRVALARAVYNDAEIYFLDDPLSAVDAHVGKHIFENVVGPTGLLKKKTRVLVTHGITYLPEVDNIVVLKEGEITEIGTYKQLLEKRGAFADFLIQHLQEVKPDEDPEGDLTMIKQQLESTMGADELQHKLSKARSRVSITHSDSGSTNEQKSLSGSLQRQQSTESHISKSESLQRSASIKGRDSLQPKSGEKIIEIEKAETGSVKLRVYAHYLKSIGWFLSLSTIVMNAIFQSFSIGSNVWLTKWSDDNTTFANGTADTVKRDTYLSVYGALGLGQASFVLFVQLTMAIGCIRSSKLLHGELLFGTMRAPIGFFDTTPSGRILNRFGKDVDVIDNVLPPNIRAWLFCLAGVLAHAPVSFIIILASNGTIVRTMLQSYSIGMQMIIFLKLQRKELKGLLVCAVSLFMAYGSIRASIRMLETMLSHVLRNPMSFFDSTPSGRILNRFAKDIDVVDNVLSPIIRSWLSSLFVSIIVTVITVFVANLCIKIGTLRSSAAMLREALHNVLRGPMCFFDTVPIGRVLSRFSADVDTMDSKLPMSLEQWLSGLFRVISTLVVISFSTPEFMSVIIPIGVIYYFIQRFYVATSRQLKRLESVSRSPIYSHFGESVTGAQTIRAFGVQDRFILESENRVDFNQVCYYPSIIANRWLAIRLEMVGNLIIFFAALFAVLGRDKMSAGLVGLSVSYALQITQTLNWLVRMTSDVETNIVAVERIKEYGETPQEAPWEIPDQTPPKEWPAEGRVEFCDYKVRYREGLDLVLNGLSFSVNGGEKIGIVGRTGAGKSSLTLSLFRIIEAANGRILIDGIDISKLGLHSLRSRLTIIPQDPVLFSGNLRINLDPFDHHTDEEIWRALEHAHLKAFVKTLPTGLLHAISEGGDNLSVGQRQLICLARALLRKTKILILDEATAAVDLETDDLIQRTIREEFKDCTVLTIAHRLNTILDSDRVIVLDRGYITEFDAPEALLGQPNSAFYSMAKDAGLVG